MEGILYTPYIVGTIIESANITPINFKDSNSVTKTKLASLNAPFNQLDTLDELTADNGVTIETVSIKDGHINELKKLIFKNSTELVIAAGVITVTQSRHTLDTQNGDATDDLVTINGGEEGQILLINTESGARDVVLKHGTGNILVQGGDYTLSDAYQLTMLVYGAGYWMKVI